MHRLLLVFGCAWFGAAIAPVPFAQTTIIRPHYAFREHAISGTVVHSDGSPVENASVVLRATQRGGSIERARATTAADGSFSFVTEAVNYEGPRFLEIEAAGFAPTLVERVPDGPQSAELGPIVVLPFAELRGRVTTLAGQPIAGAEIHALVGGVPRDDEVACTRTSRTVAVTDEHGEFVTRELAPGRVALGASADGFADLVLPRRELTLIRTEHADFVLEPERVVRLELRSASGARLEGAEVSPAGFSGRCGGWPEPADRLSFWRVRAPAEGDAFVVRGLSAGLSGQVVVTAPGHRPELALLDAPTRFVVLEPSRVVEITAAREPGQAQPEIYSVEIRDDTSPSSWCGDAEEAHWLRRWIDSPGVEKLAPDHWRIAWNSAECYVEGGRPQRAMVWSTDGDRALVESPVGSPSAARVAFAATFAAPARWSGTVRDASGAPVSIRVGLQLSGYREDMLSTMSDERGRFVFDPLGAGFQWLHSLDERWTMERPSVTAELKPGQAAHCAVIVSPSPTPRVGRVRGKLRIGGQAPGEPVLLALDRGPYLHLPSTSADGYAWTDADGNFELTAREADRYHVVSKHRAPLASWRCFATEFPAHGREWSRTVQIPESGVREVVLDLPLESDWDRAARRK